MSDDTLRSASLFGRDHTTVGALAAIAEGSVAITLSRGGAAKGYAHTEPNEDAALFAYGPGGALVAVADGHHGATGAQAVMTYLETDWADRLTASAPLLPDATTWQSEAARLLGGANHAVLADAARRGLPPAPTTLALAVWRPAEALLLWAGIGDSHVFTVDRAGASDPLRCALAERRTGFFGYEALSATALAERSASGACALAGLRAVVLATDGLSESGIGVDDPEQTVHAAVDSVRDVDPDLRPLELARRVSRAAMAAHRRHASGDNIASAAIWLAD